MSRGPGWGCPLLRPRDPTATSGGVLEISLATNAVLNLNGGVYQISRLTLGGGARLEPSEPVVLLVSGGVTTGIGAAIRPSAQSLNPMSAADIRIEVGGAATLGNNNQMRAHLVVTGKLTTGKLSSLAGAVWAKNITIGAQNTINSDGLFAAVTPAVPPPCNDNNTCTVDQCVGSGTAAFCRNTPAPSGASCDDGRLCNGAELCDGAGTCVIGSNAPPGTSCADGSVCNGDETCDGAGTCTDGTALPVDDGNPCTADVCDAITGVSHVALPDGTRCNGFGTCTAGACSIAAHSLYAINDSTAHLERIDPDTLAVTDVGPLGVPYAFGDCMFNPSDSQLYMVDGRGNFGLYRVDLATGHATLVGLNGVSAMEALAFHPPTNKIYSISIDVFEFYSLNQTTGTPTAIGPVFSRFQGMAWDSTRNQMVTFDGNNLFTVDVTTGAMTFLASPTSVVDYGMTYDPVIDRFWVVDTVGHILQFNPNSGYSTTLSGSIPGPHTCVAFVPQ